MTIRKSGRRARSDLVVTRADGGVVLRAETTVQPGWFVYAPGAEDGLPAILQVTQDGAVQDLDLRYPSSPDGHLAGRFAIETSTRVAGVVEVRLRLQACNGQTCEVPELIDFGVVDLAAVGVDGASPARSSAVDGADGQTEVQA